MIERRKAQRRIVNTGQAARRQGPVRRAADRNYFEQVWAGDPDTRLEYREWLLYRGTGLARR